MANKMEQANKPQVQVNTLRCGGYSLSIQQEGIESQEYMYWTVEELVIGMTAHLIDGVTGPMERGDMTDIVCDHIKQADIFKKSLTSKDNHLKILKKQCAAHAKDKKELKAELTKLQKRLNRYERKFGTL